MQRGQDPLEQCIRWRLIGVIDEATSDPGGLTRSALARQLGVSADHLSKILREERAPWPGLIARVARILGVRYEYLMEGQLPIRSKATRSSPAVAQAENYAFLLQVNQVFHRLRDAAEWTGRSR